MIMCSYLILSKTPSSSIITRFILETGIKFRNMGLKSLQLFQSYSEDVGSTYQDRAMDIYEEMEQSLVNGELPFSKYGQQPKAGDTDLEEFQDKQYKSDYKDLQIQFADKLKYLSIKLKTIPVNDR
jgi:hypothetical protein